MHDSKLTLVKFLPLRPNAKLPTKGSELAAGWDLYACLPEDITAQLLSPGESFFCPCGFAVEMPRNFEMQVRPRSGLAYKNGVTVLNAPGTIDADYRGEVGVLLYNTSGTPFLVENGMRIAQAVFSPVWPVAWVTVDTLSDTVRGEGGLGSTGVA